MKSNEWKDQSMANLSNCQTLFSKSDARTILDFIETAFADMVEAEKKLEGPKAKEEVKGS